MPGSDTASDETGMRQLFILFANGE